MKMIRCRSAAFRSIVKDRPAGPKISQELKVGSDMFLDSLKAMIYVGDSVVRRKNRQENIFGVRLAILRFKKLPSATTSLHRIT